MFITILKGMITAHFSNPNNYVLSLKMKKFKWIRRVRQTQQSVPLGRVSVQFIVKFLTFD